MPIYSYCLKSMHNFGYLMGLNHLNSAPLGLGLTFIVLYPSVKQWLVLWILYPVMCLCVEGSFTQPDYSILFSSPRIWDLSLICLSESFPCFCPLRGQIQLSKKSIWEDAIFHSCPIQSPAKHYIHTGYWPKLNTCNPTPLSRVSYSSRRSDKSRCQNRQEAEGCWLISGPLCYTFKSPLPSEKRGSCLNMDIRQICQLSQWVVPRKNKKNL